MDVLPVLVVLVVSSTPVEKKLSRSTDRIHAKYREFSMKFSWTQEGNTILEPEKKKETKNNYLVANVTSTFFFKS